MKTFKFYYINLDRSHKRKEFIQEQFKKFNVDIARISAYDGATLDDELIINANKNQNRLAHFMNLTKGEIGCFMSHIKAWDMISKQKEDFAIILEDDVLVDSSLFDDLQDILESISIDDFVDITARGGFYIYEKNELISKFLVPPLGLTAQIIGKNASKRLFNNSNKYIAPIDVIKQNIYQHTVNIYSTNKKYISHYDYMVGGSDAQNKSIPIYKKLIRELFRPFWQFISLFTFKIQRVIRNYIFYKFNDKK